VRRLRRWVEGYRPDFVVFESNAMARWIAVDVQDRLGIPIVKSELKDTKIEEIESFRDLAEAHLMLYAFADDGITRQRIQVFEQELEGYPDEAPHDDTLIAAIHAMRKLRPGDLGGMRVHVAGSAKKAEKKAVPIMGPVDMHAPTPEEEWRRDLIAMRRAAGISFGPKESRDA